MDTPERTILVPLDGSAFAQRAVPWSTYLALRLGAPLTLLRVVASAGSPEAQAHRDLRRLAAHVERHGVLCDRAVLVGDALPTILRRARTARFVAIAGQERVGPDQHRLGTVADQLVQRSPVPVLVQPAAMLARLRELPWQHGAIVVPLDGSELAELALPPALDVARALRRPILLVRASDPLDEIDTYDPFIRYDADGGGEEIDEYLGRVAAWVHDQSIPATIAIDWERPETFMREIATRQRAMLVCMATRGWSGLGRFAFGHVASAVAREAEVPVLLVGPTAAEGRRSPLASRPRYSQGSEIATGPARPRELVAAR